MGIREENVDGYITGGARRKKKTVEEKLVMYWGGRRLKEGERDRERTIERGSDRVSWRFNMGSVAE